ncbi:MAG: hypothetical protein Fur002_26230 [Anaerolineales bacterium]
MKTRILVIDDDPAITELMGMLLDAHGYEALTTNSGAEGIQFVKEFSPHIILLDLMMPDIDGIEVSRAIRKFNNAPILILSAVTDPVLVANALDAGADTFLTKPVSTSVLIAHIKKMTAPRTGALRSAAEHVQTSPLQPPPPSLAS